MCQLTDRLTEEVHDTVDDEQLVCAIFNESVEVKLSAERPRDALILPHGELDQHLALLLRAPSSTAQDIVLHHGRIDTVSVCDVLDSVRSKSASVGRIDQ